MKLFNICRHFIFLLSTIFFLHGCDGNSPSSPATDEATNIVEPQYGLPIPDNTNSTNYQILLIGNSHVGPIGEIIELLIEASQTGKSGSSVLAPGGTFLDERVGDLRTLETLQKQSWSHVILQAQKYSQSKGAIYSTDAAEYWISFSKMQDSTPILFPEHPQRDHQREGIMVYELHQSIAARESACVAPIGLGWYAALAKNSSLELYQPDGNHASQTGALLTALIFYQIITGEPAIALPYIESLESSAETQELLREVAAESLALYPACEY